jgi:formamidopyrimidine-DNA glycosylase
MPERPDLEHQVPIVAARLTGATLTGVRVKKPVVVRSPVPLDVLAGRTVTAVARRGHFVCFTLDGPWDIAINLMLAGRFSFAPVGTKDPADLAVAFAIGEEELRYRDDVQMGKVYLHPHGDPSGVPGLEPVGVDVLGQGFTVDVLRGLVRKRREQVKVFLMDKATFDSFGNAYADETLWEAHIHPKATTASLPPDAVERLHAAMVKVLGDARDEIARRNPPLDAKLRDFLAVRNRAGSPCPRCGTKIRTTGVHGHDAFFCPVCQPDVAGKGFVAWGKERG